MAVRRAALLLIHGMGEQVPWQEPDAVIQGLTRRYMSRPDPAPGEPPKVDLAAVDLQYRVERTGDDPPRPTPVVRLAIKGGRRRSRFDSIDIHQVYWADRPQGLVSWAAVAGWILTSALAPVLQWPRNASAIVQEREWGRRWPTLGRLLLEMVFAVGVPALGVALVTAVVLAARGLLQMGIEARDTVATLGLADGAGVLAVAVLAAATLAALVGSYRVVRRAAAEEDLVRMAVERTERAVPAAPERIARLHAWAILSLVAAVLLAAATWLVARWLDPWDLVRATADQLGWVWWKMGLIALGLVLSRFLVRSVGDVAVYALGADPRHRFAPARREILDRVAANLARLERDYDEVFVAGHSLGSVIAYDALNERVAVDWKRKRAARKVSGFLAFGSPLDKFYYFFRRQSFGKPVLEQIESAGTFLWKKPSGRRYGEVEFEPYQPPATAIRFWVAWSPLDPLGHRVDHYAPHHQERFWYLTPRGWHSGFWRDPRFYGFMVDWLEAGALRSGKPPARQGRSQQPVPKHEFVQQAVEDLPSYEETTAGA
jgi:hypothetical protein